MSRGGQKRAWMRIEGAYDIIVRLAADPLYFMVEYTGHFGQDDTSFGKVVRFRSRIIANSRF